MSRVDEGDSIDVTGPLFGTRYTKDGPVAVITLDRPGVGNALSRRMVPIMRALWSDIGSDPSIRAVVVTGSGDRHFCTGADLSEVSDTGTTSAGPGRVSETLFWTSLQNQVWKPVICALNGLVAGGGLHFVADSDIVLAADHVELMDTHTSVGMVGAVENVGLARRMPLGSALRMTLMGRHYRMPAQRAHQIGLIDEVVAAADLLGAAIEMATVIAKNSPAAVARSKQGLWESLGRDHEEALDDAWSLAQEHWSHPDFVEGPRAFAERREPRWADE